MTTSTDEGSAPTQRASRTRQLILGAADRRFAEHGFANARLSDITADVGLTTGALYRHFPAKDDLPVALLEMLCDDLDKAVETTRTRRDALGAVLKTLDEHPGALRMHFERGRWAGGRTPRDPRRETAAVLAGRLDLALPAARRSVVAALLADILLHYARATHDGGLEPRPPADVAATLDELVRTGVYPDPAARPAAPLPAWEEGRFEPSIRWHPSPSKVLPRSVKGIRTRQLIQETAAQVFMARGLAGATIQDVAEEAGIASGSVYRYFVDKADILHSLQASVEEAIIRDTHLPLDNGRLAIRGQMLAYLDCYKRHLGALRAWRELAEPGSELAAAWNGMRNSFVRRATRVLQHGQAAGIARTDLDVALVAQLHSMGYEGPAHSRFVFGYDVDVSESRLAETLERLFVGGFAA